MVRNWSETRSYKTGDQVLFDNASYECLAPNRNVEPGNVDHWVEITQLELPAPKKDIAVMDDAAYSYHKDGVGKLVLLNAIDNARDTARQGECHVVDTVKDVGGNLAHQLGENTAAVVGTVRDTGINIIQDVKDAETRLNSAAGDRFIQTIQDIKDAEVRLGDKVVQNRVDIHDEACEVKEVVERVGSRNLSQLEQRFSELSREAGRNQMETLLQFKDVQLQAERVDRRQERQVAEGFCNASRELAECCCEMKEQAAETRALVAKEAADTRELIKDIKMQDLRDRAEKAERALDSATQDTKFQGLIQQILTALAGNGKGN